MIGVNLDIWSLFSEKKLLLLIPLILIGLLLSKLVPVYLLKIWYDTKTVVASAFLLTSTLSLVIAAATIGERMRVITPEMSGTLILVAVISSIFTPIVFKKLFPKEVIAVKKIPVAFLGANQITLPVSSELKSSLYEPILYHTKMENSASNSLFDIIEIPDYSIETLKNTDVLRAEIVVISTTDEKQNAVLSRTVKEKGVPRVIARIESPELERT